MALVIMKLPGEVRGSCWKCGGKLAAFTLYGGQGTDVLLQCDEADCGESEQTITWTEYEQRTIR